MLIIYAIRFTIRIVELHEEESQDVLAYLTRHVSENHDMQVRFRWGKNDVAIWDNRRASLQPTVIQILNNYNT